MFKHLPTKTLLLLAFFCQVSLFFACQSKMTKVENKAVAIDSITGEAYNKHSVVDSVFEVHSLAAVFYVPKQSQLDSLKAANPTQFDQIVKQELLDQAAAKEFMESKNIRVFFTERRYLQFTHSTGSPYIVDRTKTGKMWGVFLFDHENPPRDVEMDKIELEYLQYFLK